MQNIPYYNTKVFDGLRIVLCFIIVVGHFKANYYPLLATGRYGVQMFFMMGAYIFTYIILKNSSVSSIVGHMIKRPIRLLFIPILVAIFIAKASAWFVLQDVFLAKSNTEVGAGELLKDLLPLWTLKYQIYIVFVVIFLTALYNKHQKLYVLFSILVLILFSNILISHSRFSLFFSLNYEAFLFGHLLCLMHVKWNNIYNYIKYNKLTEYTYYAALIILVLCFTPLIFEYERRSINYMFISCIALIELCMHVKYFHKAFNNKLFLALAPLTFSIYVLHFPLQELIRNNHLIPKDTSDVVLNLLPIGFFIAVALICRFSLLYIDILGQKIANKCAKVVCTSLKLKKN